MHANGQPANDQLKSLAEGAPSTDARHPAARPRITQDGSKRRPQPQEVPFLLLFQSVFMLGARMDRRVIGDKLHVPWFQPHIELKVRPQTHAIINIQQFPREGIKLDIGRACNGAEVLAVIKRPQPAFVCVSNRGYGYEAGFTWFFLAAQVARHRPEQSLDQIGALCPNLFEDRNRNNNPALTALLGGMKTERANSICGIAKKVDIAGCASPSKDGIVRLFAIINDVPEQFILGILRAGIAEIVANPPISHCGFLFAPFLDRQATDDDQPSAILGLVAPGADAPRQIEQWEIIARDILHHHAGG